MRYMLLLLALGTIIALWGQNLEMDKRMRSADELMKEAYQQGELSCLDYAYQTLQRELAYK